MKNRFVVEWLVFLPAGWLALPVGLPGCARNGNAEPAAGSEEAGASAVASGPVPAARLERVEVPVQLERSCREICDRSRKLNCVNADKCMPNCFAMGSLTPCTDEVTKLYRCLAGEPIRHWECAPDGVAAIQPGFCDREQEQTLACAEGKMQ